MEAIDFHSPEHTAKHLATYISDPSKIFAYVKSNWGRSPSLDQIKGYIPKPVIRQDIGEPTDADGDDYRPRGFALQQPVKREWKAPQPTNRPWPKWYKPHSQRLSAASLIRNVAYDFNVSPTDITGLNRSSDLIGARAVIAKILRQRGHSYPVIGRVMGGRDHSTIINSCKNFSFYAKRDPRVAEAFHKYSDSSDHIGAADAS